ncbi:hypothetical protein ACH4C2_11855 [Streptomyces sp. NPDC018057]|uniref:hypothetical protein n=1 Tax=unclassified Streptomyces TaxID=2593676 RepID=UPI00378C78C1
MIYRHHIAPSRAFSQTSHDIIRHPRLNSDAVRILTWQNSLPPGSRESLSRTAERARIKGCAFTRAKRQLKQEGFVHERRVQVAGGLWVTQQLVSNVPLSEAEAAKILGGTPVATPSAQVGPSGRHPAVGDPAGRLSDGLPYAHVDEDTTDRPPRPPRPAVDDADDADSEGGRDSEDRARRPEHPVVEPEPEPAPDALLEEARALTSSYPALDPSLRTIPRAMFAELTALTVGWLAAGHPPSAVRAHILRNLPDGDTRVQRPGGLLRYLLGEVPPARAADPAPLPRAPWQQEPVTGSPRLAALRECEGDHVQATLFRPTGKETLCQGCAASAQGSTRAGVPRPGRR